jgi:hypothetical protein
MIYIDLSCAATYYNSGKLNSKWEGFMNSCVMRTTLVLSIMTGFSSVFAGETPEQRTHMEFCRQQRERELQERERDVRTAEAQLKIQEMLAHSARLLQAQQERMRQDQERQRQWQAQGGKN